MWMSCQPMAVLQRQHLPEWLGYAHVHRVYEVLLVSDEMKCPQNKPCPHRNQEQSYQGHLRVQNTTKPNLLEMTEVWTGQLLLRC